MVCVALGCAKENCERKYLPVCCVRRLWFRSAQECSANVWIPRQLITGKFSFHFSQVQLEKTTMWQVSNSIRKTNRTSASVKFDQCSLCALFVNIPRQTVRSVEKKTERAIFCVEEIERSAWLLCAHRHHHHHLDDIIVYGERRASFLLRQHQKVVYRNCLNFEFMQPFKWYAVQHGDERPNKMHDNGIRRSRWQKLTTHTRAHT